MNEQNISEYAPETGAQAGDRATAGTPDIFQFEEKQESQTPDIPVDYAEEDIKTLDWREHIRLRPGMYIGKLGDGSYNDDGIYVLLRCSTTPSTNT